jgi:cardiolipin synthase
MVEVRGRLALSLQSAFSQLWTHKTGELLAGEAFYPTDAHDAEHEGEGERIRRHINVNSSPSSEAHPMRAVFWLSIKSAHKSVYITNPYFVPDDLLCQALNEHNDVWIIRWASHSYYETLLQAGIRIYEFQPTMIHQKLLVVDGIWSVIGSVNMDVRSKELNQENAIGLLDEGFAEDLELTFFEDLKRAEEIHLEEWRRRPFYRKIPERFFRLFEEQF